MSANDIIPFDDGTYMPGTKRFKVLGQGRANGIKPGELAFKTLGNTAGYAVSAWAPGVLANVLRPSVGTDYIAGLAMSESTETATANGVVDVMPIVPGMTFLIDPLVAATWDTQAEYDALVGARIKIARTVTTKKLSALAVDFSYNGAVVEPLDVIIHPGKVRVSFRQALMYTS
jgi:hypothetical protein